VLRLTGRPRRALRDSGGQRAGGGTGRWPAHASSRQEATPAVVIVSCAYGSRVDSSVRGRGLTAEGHAVGKRGRRGVNVVSTLAMAPAWRSRGSASSPTIRGQRSTRT
jgi:hypothetical protein